jgi:adenosyl cobinamide kinase/adenosyl cobinamide phosphate guanylyltransferase
VAARRPAPTIAVTNEVGLGVVPATPLGRTYRDVLGRVNAIWADVAAESYFVVAGKGLRLGDV